MNDFETKMAELRHRFLERAADDAQILDRLEEADRDVLIHTVHRLAGSAGLFGYPLLSDAACALEDALRDEAEPEVIRRLADIVLTQLRELQAV